MVLTAGEILNTRGRDLLTVTPDTTLYEALIVMNEHNIGAMLVKEDDEIVGIWTERDLLHNVLKPDFNPKEALIKDYMTTGLISVDYNDTIYVMLDKFLGKRLRHLMVKKDGKFVGMLSTGDVIRAALDAKTEELKKINAFVNWEYYENWHFDPKK